MIPTATPFLPDDDEFPVDFIFDIDEQWSKLQDILVTHPQHTDQIRHNLSQYAEMYRHIPSAIAIAKPAEADLYNEFGFVEYEVSHPITIAKVAKKAKKPKVRIDGMRPKQYYLANVLPELHLHAMRGPYFSENDTDAWRYVRNFDNTPEYESDDEANNRMLRLL